MVQQSVINSQYTYSFYYRSGSLSAGTPLVIVDNQNFTLTNPGETTTLNTTANAFISLPTAFIFSTVNPITSNDLPWLANYQSFNYFYSKSQSDARYAQITKESGSGLYLLTMSSGVANIGVSYPLNVASTYLTITQGSGTDKAIQFDLSASSKTAIDIASQSILQYSVNATNSNGLWINLGRLQTDTNGNSLKIEILFSQGDSTTGSLPGQDAYTIQIY
jgi:hypothetical protein